MALYEIVHHANIVTKSPPKQKVTLNHGFTIYLYYNLLTEILITFHNHASVRPASGNSTPNRRLP